MDDATTTTTSSKDMPESLALSDILAVPEPPSSTVVNPHDIQLQPFCTQPSQDQEFASRYPASAPDNILPNSDPLNDDEEDREFLHGMRKLADGQDEEQEQPLVPAQQQDHQGHAHHQHHHPQPALQQHMPPLHERAPTPPAPPGPGPHQHPQLPSSLEPGAPNGRRHYSVKKVEHQNSKANRRGPMDEMRQLVRILVKLMPSSLPFLKVDEAGGGNRVTEDDIKAYISTVLGEAPQPKWGLPDGWGAYLSELFSWACGKPVGRQEAMRCARRLPGRSWEAVDEELARLGLCPDQWPLPLTQKGVQDANAGAHLPALPAPGAGPPTMAAFGAAAGHPEPSKAQEEHPAAPKKKKARMSVQDQVMPLVPMASEKECWYLAMQFLSEARDKTGTTPALRSMELNAYQATVRNIVDSLPRASMQLNPMAAARQLLGTFQPSDGTEQMLHQQHALAIPGLGEHLYLPANSAIVPVPVASLSQLGMPNATSLPAFPNLPPLQQLLAQGRGMLVASEPASDPAPSENNPAKPLRPTARSVQQLGMQGAGYQLMPPTSEAPLGTKALIDAQKFLGGNGFAPYSGGPPKTVAAEQQPARPDPMVAAWLSSSGLGSEPGEASASGGDKQQADGPRQRLRGMVAHIATTALNQQRTQGAAAMEALGLAWPGQGQQGSAKGGEAAACSDPPAAGVRASPAPAAAV